MIRILAVLLAVLTIVCANDQCCDSYNTCCENCNHNPSCCENCCQQTQCGRENTHCCGEEKSQCREEENTNCCRETCTDVTVRPIGPTFKPHAPSSSSSDSKVDNKVAADTDVEIRNTINNVNNIDIPINIENVNTNTLSSSDKSTVGMDIESKPGQVITNGGVRYIFHPVLIPVPHPYPVPYPIIEHQQQQGCCSVVQPCVHDNCNTHQTICSDQCTSPVMYRPQNPCTDYQCSMREYGSRSVCNAVSSYPFVQCRNEQQDCSTCGNDFYKNYNSYQQCIGCFY